MKRPEFHTGNLFPISKSSAEIAFGIFDHDLKQARKCALLFEPNTTVIKSWTRFLRAYAHAFLKVGQEVNPTEVSLVDSFELASKTFQENDPTLYSFLQRQESALFEGQLEYTNLPPEEVVKIERQNRRSYRYGIIAGYTALLQEARLRGYGVLPAVPEDTLSAWHHDNIERIGRDLELFIDVVHGRGPEGMLESMKGLDKLNPYVSGYVGIFFRQEKTLNEVFMRYLGPNTKDGTILLIGVTSGKIARGIYDVCSILKAFCETRQLKASFG